MRIIMCRFSMVEEASSVSGVYSLYCHTGPSGYMAQFGEIMRC
jgi:hypothetical protein